MSDPSLSDIDFKIIMIWLNIFENDISLGISTGSKPEIALINQHNVNVKLDSFSQQYSIKVGNKQPVYDAAVKHAQQLNKTFKESKMRRLTILSCI